MTYICVPTITQYDALDKLISSVPEEVSVIIIDNGGNYKNYPVMDISEVDDGDPNTKNFYETNRVSVFNPQTNIGVAGSWNWFLRNTPPNDDKYWLIANDDVTLQANTMNVIYNSAPSNPMMLDGEGTWSFFSLHYDTVEKVGYFDENFFPAYFEDNDYDHRMGLENLSPTYNPEFKYDHEGSATLKAMDPERKKKHHIEFRTNRAYFNKKWGFIP